MTKTYHRRRSSRERQVDAMLDKLDQMPAPARDRMVRFLEHTVTQTPKARAYLQMFAQAAGQIGHERWEALMDEALADLDAEDE